WLTSPFIYAGNERFREECTELARRVASASALARHYLHLGERQRRTYFADLHAIPLKKIFYALRPAVALRWLGVRSPRTIAPMHFPTLVEESELPSAVVEIVSEFLSRKRVTRELGTGPLPAPLGAFIDDEFAIARELWPRAQHRPDQESMAAANALFRR